MKILFFIGRLETGGAENQFVALAQQWSQNGIDFVPVVSHSGGQYWTVLQNCGIKVHVLFKRRASILFERLVRLAITPIKLWRLIRQERITHIYSMLEFSNLLARIAVIGNPSVKLIWGVRTSNFMYLKKIYPKMYYAERLCGFLSKRASLVIANSQVGRFDYEKILRSNKVTVIHNGIDPCKFYYDPQRRLRKRAALGIQEQDFVIGMVGRLTPIKNHRDLFVACKNLFGQRRGIRILIVGGGDEKHRGGLLKEANDLGIIEHIIWVESITEEASLDYYNSMDVFCLPSLAEGCSNSILEAMAGELPCVVTDVGDSKWLVGGNNGVCWPGDVQELLLQLYRVLNLTQAQRKWVGVANRKRVIENFSIERMANDTLTKIRESH